MKWQSRTAVGGSIFLRLACVVALLAAGPVWGQVGTATVRGQITAGEIPLAEGSQVTATNVDTGYVTHTVTGADGSYALTGLAPGNYQIKVSGPEGEQSTQTITLRVGQTASLDISLSASAAELGNILVVGSTLIDTKTPEVSTSVTQTQIERLPQVTRNFLSFADLAPGVAFVTLGDGSTRIQSGAQPSASTNVFIDGVGQKNYVLQGGVTGQDSSRGNPFPQSAIAEYKVLTQNYKAEYDQVSGAAISAVTRSGTNEFDSGAFWDHTEQGWREPTPAEKTAGRKAESKQDQFGFSMGGPILRDRMHFFVAYEGKRNKDPKTVSVGQVNPPLPPEFQNLVGPANAPFDEDLLFGKIDLSMGDASRFELSAKLREESEITKVGGLESEPFGTEKNNDETRVALKYQFTSAGWVNEAYLTYEEAFWSPTARTSGNGVRLVNAAEQAILNAGAGPDYQRKGQEGWSIQDDITFAALNWQGAHVLKTGAKIKLVTVEAIEQQPRNPQFFYDVNFSAAQPYRVEVGAPLSGIGTGAASADNIQFGVYIQDDWEINEHLLVNVGVRWDYEESDAYLDHRTPADIVAALSAWPNVNNANSGININDYISTGSNRDAFTGAIQPRLGFSYDIDADQRHVVYGGYGRAYDRNLFDYLQLEETKGTFPTYRIGFSGDPNPGRECTAGPPQCFPWDPAYLTPAGMAQLLAQIPPNSGREIDLLRNDLKIPYSDQFSIGMRNVFGDWQTDIAYSHVESKDGFVWLLGNRAPDGSFFAPGSTWGPPWGFPVPGFGALILGQNGKETKADSLFLKIQKPYTRDSGWEVGLAYTYTDATENRQFGEHYSLDYPNMGGYGSLPSSGVYEHRVVATGIYDLPWQILVSGKFTYASERPFYGVNCLSGFNQCIVDQGGEQGFEQLDIALSKTFGVGIGDFTVRVDVLNVLDETNFDGYESWFGAPGDPNENFGVPNGTLRGPTRTFKVGFTMGF